MSAVPRDGRPIYVRLWTMLNGVWSYNDYVFRAQLSPNADPATLLTSPADGSTLSSATTTFTWNGGQSSQIHALWVGSSLNSYDLYSGVEGNNLSKTLTLPADGRPIYVRLWTMNNGLWNLSNFYTFTAALPPNNQTAALTLPANGSTLPLGTTTFTWTPGVGAAQYAMWIGSTPGANDLYSAVEAQRLSNSVNLPADGRPVYVRLWTSFGTEWKAYNDYWFTTSVQQNPAKAQLTAPDNGSTLVSTTTTFTWNSGNQAKEYMLWLGSTLGASDLFSGSTGLQTSKTVTVPSDGRDIYIRLWTRLDNTWSQYNDYIVKAPRLP